MQAVCTSDAWPLFQVADLRAHEHQTAQTLPNHQLMERAGQGLARLCLALHPHAQDIWVACGTGNNGGDGLVAARWLSRLGKRVHLSLAHSDRPLPADAHQAWVRAQENGIAIHAHAPEHWDLAVDALVGLGLQRPLQGQLAEWAQRMNQSDAPVVCADLPSGLDADTGVWRGPPQRHPRAVRHTLALLGLTPGLWTAEGRDWTGTVWLDTLDTTPPDSTLQLLGAPADHARPHASHKGSYGDVAVIGGAEGMTGAACLAAQAALHTGAGRVYLALLDRTAPASGCSAALMQRSPDQLNARHLSVVCGCGGGTAVAPLLAALVSTSARLVLDADALNAVANDSALQTLLTQRGQRELPTILTPHPLEAARLLQCNVGEVQSNRLQAARALAQRFHCVVALKGSGSVVAHPHGQLAINPTGNARLATAGTGDVLAGMMGSLMAQGRSAWEAACQAVYVHGAIADAWPEDTPLTADRLLERLPSGFSRVRQKASWSP